METIPGNQSSWERELDTYNKSGAAAGVREEIKKQITPMEGYDNTFLYEKSAGSESLHFYALAALDVSKELGKKIVVSANDFESFVIDGSYMTPEATARVAESNVQRKIQGE